MKITAYIVIFLMIFLSVMFLAEATSVKKGESIRELIDRLHKEYILLDEALKELEDSIREFPDTTLTPSVLNLDMDVKPVSIEMPGFVYMIWAGHEEALTLSKKLSDSGAAYYIEGIRLLRLNRIEDSSRALARVSEDDRLYPYARILSAQIEIMKDNLLETEEYLRGLLSHPSIKENGLSDRVHILLGQILFGRGLFVEALKEFLMVTSKSPFYMEAVIGQAWSLVKLNKCEDAIPVIEKVSQILPYDTIEQEAGIILGYCYLELKRFEQAVDHFKTLLKTFFAAEERLDHMTGDGSIRKRYISILQGKESVTLTEEEQHYISLFRSDFLLSTLLEEHRLLQTLRAGFISKEKEIIEFEKVLPLISEKGSQRIKEMREALRKLERIKEGSKRNIMESEKGLKESLYRLDTHIMNRFRKVKYELGDFKRDIMTGLNAAVSNMEKLKIED